MERHHAGDLKPAAATCDVWIRRPRREAFTCSVCAPRDRERRVNGGNVDRYIHGHVDWNVRDDVVGYGIDRGVERRWPDELGSRPTGRRDDADRAPRKPHG